MMKKRTFSCFVVTLFTGCLATASWAVTTLSDPFTDGARTNGADALDTDWYATSGATVLSVAPDGTIGTGNALAVDNASTGQGVVAGFGGVGLNQNREKIVLSFDYRLTTFGNPQDSAFRYGILSDAGTPRTGDTTGNLNDDLAYFVLTDAGAAAGSDQIRRDPGISGLLGGSDAFLAGTALGGGSRPPTNDTASHHAVFTVQRTTGSAIDLRNRIGTVVTTGTDVGLLTSNFNQIAFTSGGGSPTDFVLDNVRVERRLNIFDDTFSSAAATVGDDANDANDTAWSSISGNVTFSVVNAPVIGSGSAMSVVTTGDFRNVVTGFADVELAVGEKIIASFDLQLTQFANVGQGFRFGLYDDVSTALANEGYFVGIATGTASGLDITKDLSTGGGLFGGGGNQGLGGTAFNIDETSAHFIEWVVVRTGIDSTFMELYIDGVLRHTVTDASGAFSRFGAFGFLNGGSGASTDFIVDNLVIDIVQVVPEPATAVMGLLGLASLMARRRRA